MLRWLAMQWFRESAARAAREALAEKVSQAASKVSEEESVADPSKQFCDVAILCALPIEAAGLIETLRSASRVQADSFVAHRGLLGQQRVVVAVTGSGEKRAAQATQAILTAHRPQWIIASGFAGGLQANVRRTDLVVADCLMRPEGERLAIGLSMEAMPGVHVGGLLTIDHIARTAKEKRTLGQESAALALDMETYAIAKVCRAEKVRMMAVRAITDAVDDELPRDIEHLMNQATTVGRVGAATGAIFRRPGSVKEMWNLREQAILCGDRLAEFLPEIVAKLT